MDTPRSTKEYSISLSSTAQPLWRVSGPTYDPLILLPASMITGLTILDPSPFTPLASSMAVGELVLPRPSG